MLFLIYIIYNFFNLFFINLASEDAISFMNSFLNQFNNTVKTTRANKKWNLEIHHSPEPKIVSFVTDSMKLIK